jgi:hypothetical protein
MISNAKGIYGIGPGLPTSVDEVPKLIDQLNKSSQGALEHVQAKDREIKQIWAEISQTRSAFRHTPMIELRDRLGRTITGSPHHQLREGGAGVSS